MASSSSKTKAVIFAGGIGTRMWPLSRQHSPKQFEKIIDNQSTLQLSVSRLRPEFAWRDIYISTGQKYIELIKSQVPQIPKQNIIAEPKMRDVAPAVGYVAAILKKISGGDHPLAILWSDHLIKKPLIFKKVLAAASIYIKSHPNKILFIGQKARFPNQNLGWIQHGKSLSPISTFKAYAFKNLHYRPSPAEAKTYFKNSNYSWNPGYWVSTPNFILSQYQTFMPDMYQKLLRLQASYGQKGHQKNLDNIYPQLEKISFDNAILERMDPKDAIVVTTDLGWSDVGTWEALKEALQTNNAANLIHGKTFTHQTQNSLVYNYTNKLVTTINLSGMLVVVTDDVILVCPQDSVPQIKNVVQSFKSTANEKFT